MLTSLPASLLSQGVSAAIFHVSFTGFMSSYSVLASKVAVYRLVYCVFVGVVLS